MVAIIPARGGSKGLPGKNIRELNGKPLITYTITAALEAGTIDRVIVNTDDEVIANIAKKSGAEIPFIREKKLASDNAMAIDVYIDTMERLGDEYIRKPFMVLLPTVPFRTTTHIEEACRLFEEKGARSLVSVTKAEIPASWYLSIDEAGLLHSSGYGMNGGYVQNRQQNRTEYVPNGAIYILDYNLLKEHRTYYGENTIPYVMERNVSLDIDTQDDFDYAEYLMKRNRRAEVI